MIASRNELTAAPLLLARWWSRPTAQERESWAALWAPARDAARALVLEADDVEELDQAQALAGVDELLDEYERLLVGPGRPPCAPYESLWRADLPGHEEGMLMGSAAAAVERLYGELGVRPHTEQHELPDHLLLEWEAVAYALDRGAGSVADQLLRDHLGRWIDPFCTAVEAETGQPFYGKLARLTRVWTAALVT